MNPGILLALAAGTLVSEDLASMSAGLLARDGVIGLAPAMAACTAGVYAGDLVLWVIGRLFRRQLLGRGWMVRRVDPLLLTELGMRLDAHLAWAVLGSRFLPGSRLPMYLAAGVFGRRPLAFAVWSLVAVLLWTPALVWITWTFGASVSTQLLGEQAIALRYALATLLLCAAWRLAIRTLAGALSSHTSEP